MAAASKRSLSNALYPSATKKLKLNAPTSNAKVMSRCKSTISITFGDAAENHVGMEMNGVMAAEGFSVEDLRSAQNKFKDCETELVMLNDYLPIVLPTEIKEAEESAVLVIRKGLNCLLEGSGKSAKDVYEEQAALPIDVKYFDRRRKKVLNKHARGNLCFAATGHDADYEQGNGAVVAYEDVPLTQHIRQRLRGVFGSKAKTLVAEGNFDVVRLRNRISQRREEEEGALQLQTDAQRGRRLHDEPKGHGLGLEEVQHLLAKTRGGARPSI